MNDEHETPDAVRRAGPNMWLWSGFSLQIVENTLDLGDLDPIVVTVQPEFSDLRIERRVAGTMAGGDAAEGALLLVFSALAVPFLAEASKDAYKGFRAAVFAAYKKAKTWANNRGYAPLSIMLEDVPPDQRVADATISPSLYFVFRPGLDATEFERAFVSFLEAQATIQRTNQSWLVVLEWDASAGTWTET